MKNRISKILGMGLALVLALALVAGFVVPVAAAETINEWDTFAYPKAGSAGDWFRQGTPGDGELIAGTREITEAINGDLYVYAYLGPPPSHEILKSEDGGRTWALTKYSDATDGVEGVGVIDMVCSSIDEDILYVTDGFYVYKSVDGGDTWDFVAQDSLEEQLKGACGCPVDGLRTITCLDVAYDDDDNPFVFIGTRRHLSDLEGGCANDDPVPGSVYWIGEAGYPATWSDLRLECYVPGDGGSDNYDAFAIGCAPDWADSKETYVVVSDNYDTHVIYSIGGTCSWIEFAELLEDCEDEFDIWGASRIGFPDDWEDVETLFVGVVADDNRCGGSNNRGGDGGDVYLVTDGSAIDLNVAGIVTGCEGEEAVDIISLDIEGDYDEASLIAGAYCTTDVYYSYDGGWSWDASAKDPTGDDTTYVIWYEDTALAATWGCESAVSISCVSDDVEDVGESWNQISLIATDIDMVRWLGFSPGYVCEDTETMYMVTWSEACDETNSVFRYDQTYWERVFLADYADYGGYDAEPMPWWWVEVSPDFNETNCVYLANREFEMFRTTDAGCSWKQLTFPCYDADEYLTAMVVIDEDTVVAGVWDDDEEVPEVWKTTRHGARPWKEYELPEDVCEVKSFALEPGYEDPGSILLGDRCSQVCISEDGAEEWELVGDCAAVLDPEENGYKTWVVFDPAYATTGIIYAAAGSVIARCVIDFDEDWADQEWEEICTLPEYPEDAERQAYGIAAAGDTALYVASATEVARVTQEVDGNGVTYIYTNGGVMRSLNPDADDAADVVFERLTDGLVFEDEGDSVEGTELRHLWLTCDTSDDGCAENVLWSLERIRADHENVWVWEDTLAAPVVLDTPVDGQKLATTDSATLSWNELCGADCYEVSLWEYCPECPDEKLTVDLSLDCCPGGSVVCGPDALPCPDDRPCTEEICIVIDDLDPGTTYYWQVRVCQGKPFLSKWSEERTFTTAMLAVPFRELCSPECGGQDIILTPNFSWGPVDGATGYDIELAITETFTAGVVRGESTINAWVAPEAFEYATTYYWRVRAEKDGVYSDWTYCMFTTMEAPVPAAPPVEIVPAPPAPQIDVIVPAAQMITPTWIYAIIGIGTALVVVVIVLTVRTRRPPA